MPRIILDGCDKNKIIQQISVNVKVEFSHEYWTKHSLKAGKKMKELEEEFGQIVAKYFPDYSSDTLTNREYYLRMTNF